MKTIFWNCDYEAKEKGNSNSLDSFALENKYQLIRTSSGFSEKHYGIFSSGNNEKPYEINMDDLEISYLKIEKSREINIQRNGVNEFLSNPHSLEIVNILDPKRIIVYGGDIEETVKGFKNIGKEVYVVIDAVKEIPNKNLEKLLNKWTFHGIKIVKTGEVLNYLNW
jgi:hypothetical protein